MARIPQVTRTVKLTEVTVSVADMKNATVNTEVYELPRTYKNDKAILKALEKNYDWDGKVVVRVESTRTFEKLYGMTEVEFLKYARELPPRAANADEEEPEDENE